MRSGVRTVRAMALWLLPAALPLRAETAQPTWDEAFRTEAAPTAVYFRAGYLDGFGRRHRLRVWRDADRRLRRSTDQSIDLYVERNGDGEYGYRLVDHARKTIVSADRAMLYRIGIFSDWQGLAHVLDRPRGPYAIARDPPEDAPTSPEGCAWYRLAIGSPSRVSRVCWSGRWGVPLAIDALTENGGWERRFTVEDIHMLQPDARTFAPQDGFVPVDANSGADPVD